VAASERPPIDELLTELEAHADPAKRDWWVRYLKGQARFLGVPTPTLRGVTGAWWGRHDADGLPPDDQLEICLALLREPVTEPKLAGMLLLGERLVPADRVDWAVAMPRFGPLFVEGHLADWNVVDWFCVRVLGPLIERSGDGCARAVAAWIDAAVLWQRRAALVGFVTLAPSGAYAELIIQTAAQLVTDPERFAQTGVAWVLRELRTARPDLVEPFLAEHHQQMSTGARKQARGTHR
jgi:3-methyladenine DNA glycosylase AlkD